MPQTIDLLAWPTQDAAAFSYASGAQLVVQRFLLELLTEQGSIRYRPTRGTTFITDLRSGRIHTETDLQAIFALAESLVRRQLQDEETDAMPGSERYLSAALSQVELSSGLVRIQVQIQTRAGSTGVTSPLTI